MTITPNPAQELQQRAGATINATAYPSYASFRHLPEAERWGIYELAKSGWLTRQEQGHVMPESYDAFVRRITEELDL
ncbi:hypothetical protein AL532_12050 [Pseudomonas monteilii]|uniref:hypothetical protein n=1 Tax=Pseudomonas monteilii TaxID=76759 RepID=UPI000CEB79D8|nr:hypothetical protein [Pseudomonas monteilii]AVH37001.1 hypothetical protein AL532_12050 [Pseudomonas monteilii]